MDHLHVGAARTMEKSSKKKHLLVLDLNGILVDVVLPHQNHDVNLPYKMVSGKLVFKRPFCAEFLEFCFENFDVGIWSSRRISSIRGIIDYLVPDGKDKFLFFWDQTRCTIIDFRTQDNDRKTVILKELKRLWKKEDSNLPWEKGQYLPSNTLLVDDSPYKALCNPPYTAIFPTSYRFKDMNDNSLGPGGDLRVYLEGLAGADDVQKYVQENPFGQNAITSTHPSWNFYQKIITAKN